MTKRLEKKTTHKMNACGQRRNMKDSSGIQYQKWSLGINGCDATEQKATMASKLDPNSKPFSPRTINGGGSTTNSTMSSKPDLDENENKVDVDGDKEDKLRQIWCKKGLSETNKPPPLKLIDHNQNPNPKNVNNNVEKSPMNMNMNANEMVNDDYGLRSLVRNINKSVASMRSETCSILSETDLGMSKAHREFFSEKKLLFPYIESPLSNNVVSPLSDYCQVPEEYQHGLAMKQSLPKIELNRLATDVLFFLFYTAVGDAIQLQAANELYTRGWRFNITHGLWVARLPSVNPEVRQKTFEKGVYQYFNPSTWRRETKTMTLYYSELSFVNKY